MALQDAAKDVAKRDNAAFEKVLKTSQLQVGFEGSFGSNAVSPRGLNSALLNSLVVVEGIVTKCSNVRPKLVRSVHFTPETNTYFPLEHRDNTAIDIGITIGDREHLPTPSILPTKDKEGKACETEQGLCTYKDYQTVILQEMPERAKVGQLPRSIEMILEHDLVDHVKPGDRAQCVGVYRPLASVQDGQTSGVFKSILLCNNVSIIGKEVGAVKLTGTDVGNIR
jgi:DNA replication licensing factor MCM3